MLPRSNIIYFRSRIKQSVILLQRSIFRELAAEFIRFYSMWTFPISLHPTVVRLRRAYFSFPSPVGERTAVDAVPELMPLMTEGLVGLS